MGHPVPITPEPKKGQFTWDSTCMEMKDSSLVMKLQYKISEHIVAKGFGGKKDYSDPAFKMMTVCATDCPLRAAVISAGGFFERLDRPGAGGHGKRSFLQRSADDAEKIR